MSQYAPIALFVYARPEHTRQTLEALAANPEAKDSLLYVFADGPPDDAAVEVHSRIGEVRRIVRERQWCGEVRIIESDVNRGLADSIVSGVTDVVERHCRVIVLEDDIVTSPGFLDYMNRALDLYDQDARVMQVSGYAYPTDCRSRADSYFLRAMSCWGWATWSRAWRHFESDAAKLLAYWTGEPEKGRSFDLDGSGDYLDQLKANVDARKRTWAVKWFASWMKEGGLCLYPKDSLTRNIGHDDTGENCGTTEVYAGSLAEKVALSSVPRIEDKRMRLALARFYRMHVTHYRKYPSGARSIMAVIASKLGLRHLRRAAWLVLKKAHPNLKLLEREGFRYHYDSSRLDSEVSAQASLAFPCHVESSRIGRYTYIAQNAWIFRTHIGSFCSIGPNFSCGWGTHPLHGISTSPMFYSTRKQNGVTLCSEDKVSEFGRIEIGSDVFIGMNVTVLDGVTIGHGAVIGAGAVVSKDIPPYAVAVGCPIRIIRYRFEPTVISCLLASEWWNGDEQDLQEIEKNFFDVERFLKDRSVKHQASVGR